MSVLSSTALINHFISHHPFVPHLSRHYLGMVLICAGAAVVGAASILYAPHPNVGQPPPLPPRPEGLLPGAGHGLPRREYPLLSWQTLLSRGLRSTEAGSLRSAQLQGPSSLPAGMLAEQLETQAMWGSDMPPGATSPVSPWAAQVHCASLYLGCHVSPLITAL